MARRWLLLIYTVPTTPSRTRAFVWREIRRAGALLVRDGVAALPAGAEAERWVRETSRRIDGAGGTATIVMAKLKPSDERRIVAAFQKEREREYSEIVASCEALLLHLEREREHAVFTFEEFQELENDLEKIRRWYAMARSRDHFSTSTAKRAASAISDCEKRIAAYAERASALDSEPAVRARRRRRAKVT
ncbi:MAG: hypothetical protein E6I57_05535 [Chloroflexi bacterium]|nr:MAG: hypothetical protein E6I57_05535 [Chloroflexota bacterium]